MMRLFEESAKHALVRKQMSNDKSKDKELHLYAIACDNLRNLLLKEHGPSVFSVIVATTKYTRPTSDVKEGMDSIL